MRYVAAYLLTVLGGKTSPKEADIKKILDSVGIEAESANIKKVIAALEGKSIEEVIEAGKICTLSHQVVDEESRNACVLVT